MSFCVYLWMMERVFTFWLWDMEDVKSVIWKGCVKRKFSFILVFQMSVVTRPSLSILIWNYNFSHKEFGENKKIKLSQCHNCNNNMSNCHKNTRFTRILCLCWSMVVWCLGFTLRNEAKDEKKNDTQKERMKAYLRFEPSSFNFWP